ncbi:MAG: peptide chain release factor 2 [Candidatus Saccharimonadales bacterium]
MNDINDQASQLDRQVKDLLKRLDFDDLQLQLDNLNQAMLAPDFWQDNLRAQNISKDQAKLQQRLAPWQALQTSLDEIVELSALDDPSLSTDLSRQLAQAQVSLQSLQDELKFSGRYDSYDAILSIYAGAGGRDAQDWAAMLVRMYVRWTEQNKYSIKTIDESTDEGGGIKSATIEISGNLIYGKLKGEHGVHRLVRLSPFNSAHSRETSFAKVDVLPKIEQSSELEIDDKDLRIDVYRSGGHGGQSVNTTDSAVRITHLPTGIVVAIQNERSQLQNKETALTILRSRLALVKIEQHKETIEAIKGPSQSNEFGSQIRNYVLHPYKQVKDLRTGYEVSDPDAVLGGDLAGFINAYLEYHVEA